MDDNIRLFARSTRTGGSPSDGAMFAAWKPSPPHRNLAMSPRIRMIPTLEGTGPAVPANTRSLCNSSANDVRQRWRGRYNEDLDLSISVSKPGGPRPVPDVPPMEDPDPGHAGREHRSVLRPEEGTTAKAGWPSPCTPTSAASAYRLGPATTSRLPRWKGPAPRPPLRRRRSHRPIYREKREAR